MAWSTSPSAGSDEWDQYRLVDQRANTRWRQAPASTATSPRSRRSAVTQLGDHGEVGKVLNATCVAFGTPSRNGRRSAAAAAPGRRAPPGLSLVLQNLSLCSQADVFRW